ncbi:hypothetical protein [Vibrio vulnificus]|uniref:hypothetical protein n=1 Tax=Vibrio vulnificus TaxID=672 RepID=UPI001EEB4575|nr:hypothetical protein [Vibrio vulnificus]MCG6288863.1 hypothetical protein [Vibrio vulnificus]
MLKMDKRFEFVLVDSAGHAPVVLLPLCRAINGSIDNIDVSQFADGDFSRIGGDERCLRVTPLSRPIAQGLDTHFSYHRY